MTNCSKISVSGSDGDKDGLKELINMMGVFINLLYIYTMPNNHYCSTYMITYHHLMTQRFPKVARKSSFFLI